ncbi:E3 ubiquitin-protein ligase RNF4 [Gouania willdenowi]|uniref:RING-type domain-containing protein n=1 Tax=Gouania willdenowi TaxID=441366 RepID=A0A8C5NAI6_GOUWI|nr:E3 ubiquitin-protein ligase RNF4 [Gouania willdenowi]XP_028316325.1 E3 ubiquitin-protein ligase RNF4 [Gouania willdenowi]
MSMSRRTSALANRAAPTRRTSRRASSTLSRTTTNRRTSGRTLASRMASDRSLVLNLSDVDSSPSATENVFMEDSVEEVVDLTCEADGSVVDLTSNESVLLLDEGPQTERASGLSYVVSSDDEDTSHPPPPPPPTVDLLSSAQTSRSTPGSISCPICMDSYSEMMESGRLVVATKCGHVFCSLCLRDALKSSLTCPTCRQRLRPNQYHPLYL